MESNKKCIYALTRGYEDEKKYADLICRNANLLPIIKANSLDSILFHEGNITNEQQNLINRLSGFNSIFCDIGKIFEGGYEGMCLFHTIQAVWELQRLGYSYALRVDEDCQIYSMGDPFEGFDEGGIVYNRSIYFAESHSETNATLPQFVREVTGTKENFYNDKYPYSNVGAINIPLFLSHEVNDFLKKVSESDLRKPNRWGDLPVWGCALNIFHKGRVGYIKDLVYCHSSHNIVIDSNKMN